MTEILAAESPGHDPNWQPEGLGTDLSHSNVEGDGVGRATELDTSMGLRWQHLAAQVLIYRIHMHVRAHFL